MKRPGLTEAMRRALEYVRDGTNNALSKSMARTLYELDLIEMASLQRHMETGADDQLTPRGQAALAAPRVTAAELAMLERLESWEGTIHGRDVTVAKRLRKKGLALCGFGSSGFRRAKITPAGTTALNNIRAASGSPEYKEN